METTVTIQERQAIDSLINVVGGLADLNAEPDVVVSPTEKRIGFAIPSDDDKNVMLPNTFLELIAYDSADCGIPSVTGTLDTATVGTIVGGAGSAAIKFKVSAEGRGRLVVASPLSTPLWIAAKASAGSPVLDCHIVRKVTF